ncbi:MAG TPA: NTP transferase domain-containing protein [Firmicutes bacterium]|nr:NTP transferase domain-containing protein [Bacillota bacterium]
MKAVIMAGGEGTRLRPLTCDLPKPMARLCGRPVMEYILDLLAAHGVDGAAVTLRYLPSAISQHFSARYRDIALTYEVEEQPLGTAGSVRGAAAAFPGEKELLVVSGDALTDFDLSAAVRFHREKGAAATLLVARVEDPREYGLVRYDGDGRVVGFVEKPGWAQAVTDAANTGIYILSPEALALIPEQGEYDFAKDLFPQMLAKGLPLYACEAQGYWCDIGSLDAYRAAQKDLLQGKLRSCPAPEGGILCREGRPEGDYVLTPPVYIGRGVCIGEGAQIGPFAVLDDGCCVGAGAKVRDSVLLGCAYVGERASLTGALLCHASSVRRGASLFEGAALGAGSVVGEYATVFPDVKVWPDKQVEANSVLRENLREGHGPSTVFDDAGITGETGVELTPELCARIGAAVGSLSRGGRVAVGAADDPAAAALKMALDAGILSTGGGVWDFGACIAPQFDYFVNFGRIHTGVYLSGGPRACVRLVSAGGLPAVRSVERGIEARLAGGDFLRAGWDAVQGLTDMSSMQQLYRQELIDLAPHGLSGTVVAVKGSDYACVKLLSSVLTTMGCSPAVREGEGLRLHIGAQGRRLSLYSREAGYLWPEQVLALCCLMELEAGRDVAVPYDAPLMLEELARAFGRRVRRYYDCPAGRDDEDARRLASGQLWARDGLMMAVKLLAYLKESGASLAGLAARLPGFAVATKTIPCDGNPGRVLRQLAEGGEPVEAGEGARIRLKKGTLLVRPSKRGKRLTLTAEAPDTETAAELCGELEEKLRTVFLDMSNETK